MKSAPEGDLEDFRHRVAVYGMALSNARAALIVRMANDDKVRGVMEELRSKGDYSLSDVLRSVLQENKGTDIFSGVPCNQEASK